MSCSVVMYHTATVPAWGRRCLSAKYNYTGTELTFTMWERFVRKWINTTTSCVNATQGVQETCRFEEHKLGKIYTNQQITLQVEEAQTEIRSLTRNPCRCAQLPRHRLVVMTTSRSLVVLADRLAYTSSFTEHILDRYNSIDTISRHQILHGHTEEHSRSPPI